MKWVNILLNNFIAVINHCGNISNSFEIKRGCRQGDPIAAYLFILAVEILAQKLRNSENVKGFTLDNFENTLDIYADDLSIYLNPRGSLHNKKPEIVWSFTKQGGRGVPPDQTISVFFRLFFIA